MPLDQNLSHHFGPLHKWKVEIQHELPLDKRFVGLTSPLVACSRNGWATFSTKLWANSGSWLMQPRHRKNQQQQPTIFLQIEYLGA